MRAGNVYGSTNESRFTVRRVDEAVVNCGHELRKPVIRCYNLESVYLLTLGTKQEQFTLIPYLCAGSDRDSYIRDTR